MGYGPILRNRGLLCPGTRNSNLPYAPLHSLSFILVTFYHHIKYTYLCLIFYYTLLHACLQETQVQNVCLFCSPMYPIIYISVYQLFNKYIFTELKHEYNQKFP